MVGNGAIDVAIVEDFHAVVLLQHHISHVLGCILAVLSIDVEHIVGLLRLAVNLRIDLIHLLLLLSLHHLLLVLLKKELILSHLHAIISLLPGLLHVRLHNLVSLGLVLWRVDIWLLLLLLVDHFSVDVESLDQAVKNLGARLIQILQELLVAIDHLFHDGGDRGVESHLGPGILRQSVVALDDVLEKTRRRLLELSLNHVVEDGTDGEESLSCHAEIVQTIVVQEDLLDDESCNGLR